MAPTKRSRKGKATSVRVSPAKKPATRRRETSTTRVSRESSEVASSARRSRHVVSDGAIGRTPLVGDMDTEQVITEAGLVVEESRSSAQRSARLLNECLEAGTEISSSLDAQGGKLDRIDERLDEIEENVRQARRNIRRIWTVFGGMLNIFRDRKKKRPQPKETATKSHKKKPAKKNKKPAKKGKEKDSAPVDESLSTNNALPDPEINRCLDDMGKSLVQLKDMALGIGDELERHNKVLDRVVPKAGQAEMGLSRENKNARRELI